jgi:hypothetical protein
MRILIGEPVKGTEANALRRLYQTVKDLDGLLLEMQGATEFTQTAVPS